MVLQHSDFLPILFPMASDLFQEQTLLHTENDGIFPLPMRLLMPQALWPHILSGSPLGLYYQSRLGVHIVANMCLVLLYWHRFVAQLVSLCHNTLSQEHV